MESRTLARTLKAASPMQELLRLKVALLSHGIILPPREMAGRKGGAGPTLGRYFLLNKDIVVNAPARHGEQAKRLAALALESSLNGNFHVTGLDKTDPVVRVIPRPKFYDEILPDGTPMSHVALVHGVDCLASTIVQHCDYFSQGMECHFCSLPLSLNMGTTMLRKKPEQFLAVLEAAEKEGRAKHILLTIGSPPRSDRGIREYVEFLEVVHQHTRLPIGVQVEPPSPPDQMRALHDLGVDTVGIHIEAFDDAVRQQYCPGKFQYADYSKYLAAWKTAVKIFGSGQVSTFVLLGLGDSPKQLRMGFKKCIKIGVIPVPVPCRPNPGSRLENFIPGYIGKLDQTVNTYLDCARLLKQYKLNPLNHRAGCIRCGGCTALKEAYRVVTAT
jgi:radical SAM protein (TIGR04043 family)